MATKWFLVMRCLVTVYTIMSKSGQILYILFALMITQPGFVLNYGISYNMQQLE